MTMMLAPSKAVLAGERDKAGNHVVPPAEAANGTQPDGEAREETGAATGPEAHEDTSAPATTATEAYEKTPDPQVRQRRRVRMPPRLLPKRARMSPRLLPKRARMPPRAAEPRVRASEVPARRLPEGSRAAREDLRGRSEPSDAIA